MARTEQVSFSTERIRRGEVDMRQIGAGYLAALASLGGRPPLDGAPRFEELRDWSDYDDPREEEVYEWGDEGYGVRAHARGQFVHHGQRGGTLGEWALRGVPAGSHASGESKLHIRWHSYARLVIEAPPAETERAAAAFRQALAALDVQSEPDGVGVEALEQTLTDLCWYGRQPSAAHAELLARAAAALRPDSDVANALGYLRAYVAIRTGELTQARAHLAPLVASGEGLRFSHGLNVGHGEDGAPELIAWQDDFPPPSPHHDVLVTQGWLMEQGGDRAAAIACYRRAAQSPRPEGEQARAQLRRLGVG